MIAKIMGIDHPSVFTTIPAELMATFLRDSSEIYQKLGIGKD